MNFYQQAMSQVWGAMGSGILFRYQGEVFLQERSDNVEDSGSWSVPGGALRGTEGMYDSNTLPEPEITNDLIIRLWNSALREVEEEVGVNPEISEEQFKASKKIVYRKDNFIYMTFIVDVTEEQKNILTKHSVGESGEASDHQWFPPEGVPENLHPGLGYVFDVMKNKVNVSAAKIENKENQEKWTQGQVFIDGEISYDVEILNKVTSDNRIEEVKVENFVPQLYDRKVWAEKNRELSPMMVMTNPTFDHTNIVHMKKIRMSDLDHPILIRSLNGRIVDGFHRLAQAFLMGRTKIKAVFVQEEQMKKAIVNS